MFGIDPGSRILGYGVVEEARGRVAHLGHGVIRPDADSALELRLRDIFAQLTLALELYRPDVVAVEGVFTCRNARSALILGHARGVALLVAAQRGLPVFEYAPARVKRAVGAGGAAGKDGVAKMVRQLLRIAEAPRADASDALAVALCHVHQGNSILSTAPSPKRRSDARSLLGARLAPSYRRPEVLG